MIETNQFGCREIPNDELRPVDIPGDSADMTSIFEFALTYDGYHHHGDQCGKIANAASQRFSKEGNLPQSLDELRTCLFYEQRRWHHFGNAPHTKALNYFKALLCGIREKVESK
jgi:hypothetical protein